MASGALWDEVRLPAWLQERARIEQTGVTILPDRGEPWPERGDVFLWRSNAPHWRFFRALDTQWQRAGADGVPVGLDYRAAEVVARVLRYRLNRRTFELLRAMEAAALAVWVERRQRDQK